MLRWIFQRDGRAITCELAARSSHSYELRVVPHWNASAAVVARFNRALIAIEGHAAIASGLRERGWVVIDHAVPDYVGIAA